MASWEILPGQTNLFTSVRSRLFVVRPPRKHIHVTHRCDPLHVSVHTEIHQNLVLNCRRRPNLRHRRPDDAQGGSIARHRVGKKAVQSRNCLALSCLHRLCETTSGAHIRPSKASRAIPRPHGHTILDRHRRRGQSPHRQAGERLETILYTTRSRALWRLAGRCHWNPHVVVFSQKRR